jgi:hypothetical protein
MPNECIALSHHLLALRAPDVGHPLQQLVEARQVVARALREVGTAEEGFALRREEHRERPTARAPRQQLMGGLVNLVDVGSLFPVDLDVDEVTVHQRGGVAVFEAFVRHHMAPVAPNTRPTRIGRRCCARANARRPECQSTGLLACCCR